MKQHIDRFFLYSLIAVVFKMVIEIKYWWIPLIMLPFITLEAINDHFLKSEPPSKKSEGEEKWIK